MSNVDVPSSFNQFTEQGEAYGNNITSVTFGVSERYTDDPSPVSYNFVTSSPTASATTTTRVSATPNAATSAIDSTENSSKSHGLPKATQIGVGVGVSVGVLLLALCSWSFYIFRKRSQRKRAQAVTVMNSLDDGIKPLPNFERKDLQNMRLSQAETVGTISQLSSDNGRLAEGVENRLSELMSTPRAELY